MTSDSDTATQPEGPTTLGQFLHLRAEGILAEWSRRARAIPPANALAEDALRDHFPDVFAAVAQWLSDGEDGVFSETPSLGIHALDRLEEGFELDQVLEEYALLRETVLEMWHREHGAVTQLNDVIAFNHALDHAISIAASRYASAREKARRAFDAISAAALSSDTQARQHEARSRASENRLRMLADFSGAVAQSATDLQAVLRAACRAMASSSGDVCTIRLLSEDGTLLLPGIAEGNDPALISFLNVHSVNRPIPVEATTPGRVAATGKAILLHTRDDAELEQLVDGLDAEFRLAVSKVAPQSGLLVPMRAHGRIVGVMTLFRRDGREPFDARDEALFQELADRAALAVENARLVKNLEQAVKMREEIVAIVSHDLRNPLNAISLTAQTLARRDDLDERMAKGLLRINSSAARANKLILDLLDLTQARVAGIAVKPQALDVAVLLRRTIEEMSYAHPERNILVAAPSSVPCECDPDRLSQAVMNVVSNALKYSAPKSDVRVSLDATDDSVMIEVHNVGQRIAPDALPHIFEPYRRATEHGGAQGSLGLGLYIASKVIEAHGGEITARSTTEEGTTFTMRIPRDGKPRRKS